MSACVMHVSNSLCAPLLPFSEASPAVESVHVLDGWWLKLEVDGESGGGWTEAKFPPHTTATPPTSQLSILTEERPVVEDGLGEGLATGGGTEVGVEAERLGDGEVSLHLYC